MKEIKEIKNIYICLDTIEDNQVIKKILVEFMDNTKDYFMLSDRYYKNNFKKQDKLYHEFEKEIEPYINKTLETDYESGPSKLIMVDKNDEKLNKKVDRMNKIAKEASEQSHRTRKLVVENPIDFKNLLKLKNEYDLCLYAYEVIDKDESLKNILKQKKYQNILILVGPEGGISLKEVEMLNSVGFIPISLGPRILRTEVAPTYVMAAISYELEI